MARMIPDRKSSRPPTKSRTSSVSRIEKQCVHREIAPLHIFLRRFRIHHVIRMASIRVTHVRAKRCDFHLQVGAFAGIFRDHDHAEFRADGEAIRKKLLDAIRRGIGGHIVIRGFASQQNVAHAAAHEIGLMPCRSQRAANDFRKCARVHSVMHRRGEPSR